MTSRKATPPSLELTPLLLFKAMVWLYVWPFTVVNVGVSWTMLAVASLSASRTRARVPSITARQ